MAAMLQAMAGTVAVRMEVEAIHRVAAVDGHPVGLAVAEILPVVAADIRRAAVAVDTRRAAVAVDTRPVAAIPVVDITKAQGRDVAANVSLESVELP